MSSQEEEEHSTPQVSAPEPEQAKRKKKQRACDYCRRKKSASLSLSHFALTGLRMSGSCSTL